jgi:hypothetical protein
MISESSDTHHFIMYSNILRELNYCFDSKPITTPSIQKPLIKGQTIWNQIKMFIRQLFVKLHPSPIILLSSYLQSQNWFFLNSFFKCISIGLNTINPPLESIKRLNNRQIIQNELLTYLNKNKQFDVLLAKLIAQNLPTSLIENYDHYQLQILTKYPFQKIKKCITGQLSTFNDTLLFFISNCYLNNIPIHGVQHGGKFFFKSYSC